MSVRSVDVLLVGGGVMSATLGMLLKQLDPNLSILMVEQGEKVAQESSDGWNNAGTGHAAYCELNYTPLRDGKIDISKALEINEAFETTLQFWSYLVKKDIFPAPELFINRTPHQSFVWGEENVAFLRQRFETLGAHPLFAEMEYSEDPEVLKQWMPLIMQGRDPEEKVAGTRISHGSDVDYGAVTRELIFKLSKMHGFELLVGHKVTDLRKRGDTGWSVEANNLYDSGGEFINAKFVFLGAGGASLKLLQAAGIDEGHGYGGFPVSGQWLVCRKPEIVEQHHAKVYGKAPIGAPPMSVPHLDTRVIEGEKALLFGPFAGFTMKFLKKGSLLDLISSVRFNNIIPMMQVGLRNMDLTRYLISEVLQSHESRIESLKQYFPNAKSEDWHLSYAGQRVQIIKKDPKIGGKLEFGTEVISSSDNSLCCLLGASPGASTAAETMINIIETAFKDQVATPQWQEKLKEIFPAYGQSLANNPELLKQVRDYTTSTLHLKP